MSGTLPFFTCRKVSTATFGRMPSVGGVGRAIQHFFVNVTVNFLIFRGQRRSDGRKQVSQNGLCLLDLGLGREQVSTVFQKLEFKS